MNASKSSRRVEQFGAPRFDYACRRKMAEKEVSKHADDDGLGGQAGGARPLFQ